MREKNEIVFIFLTLIKLLCFIYFLCGSSTARYFVQNINSRFLMYRVQLISRLDFFHLFLRCPPISALKTNFRDFVRFGTLYKTPSAEMGGNQWDKDCLIILVSLIIIY